MKRACAWLVLLILSVILAGATARADMIDDCDMGIGEGPNDLKIKISGCTKIIKTSKNKRLLAVGYINRGIAYAASGKPEKAISDTTKAIKLEPKNANSYKNRGSIYLKFMNRPKMALPDFKMGVKLAPKDATMYLTRGMAWHALGQSDRALEDFDKAIELKPNYGFPYFQRGIIQIGRKRYELAIIDFTQTIRLNVEPGKSHGLRALSLDVLGRTDEAIIDYKKALEINPASKAAKIRLKALGANP